MGYNKFIDKNGAVLIDLTSDTAESSKVVSGFTFHDKHGIRVEGAMPVYNGSWDMHSACTITVTLTKTTLSNLPSIILYGDSYESEVSPDAGYSISQVTILMGETDITSSAYNISTHMISINSVTDDITIVAESISGGESCSVDYRLYDATSTSSASSVEFGASFDTTIQITNAQKLAFYRIKMGNTDITSQCFTPNADFDGGTIYIPNVTNDLEIIVVGSFGSTIKFDNDFEYLEGDETAGYLGEIEFIAVYRDDAGANFAVYVKPDGDPGAVQNTLRGKEFENLLDFIYVLNGGQHSIQTAISYNDGIGETGTYVGGDAWELVEEGTEYSGPDGSIYVPEYAYRWKRVFEENNVVNIKSITTPTCLSGDTLITMADGSQKKIRDIDRKENILAVNDNGELVPARIAFIIKTPKNIGHDIWTFDDGTVVDTAGRHRFYHIESESFEYLQTFNMGEHTLTYDGKQIALIGHEHIDQNILSYTILCEYGNYFANNMLSGNRETKKFKLDELKFV